MIGIAQGLTCEVTKKAIHATKIYNRLYLYDIYRGSISGLSFGLAYPDCDVVVQCSETAIIYLHRARQKGTFRAINHASALG